MLYSLMFRNNDKWNKDGLPVIPALLFIQHTAGEKYDPTLCINKEKISDIKEFEAQFTEEITKLLEELFDTSISFIPTDDRKSCTICPYKQLCFN